MAINTLLGRTYRLLDSTALTYREIADRTGLDRNWLMKLKQRCIAEPGVTKIERLHDFLAAASPKQNARPGIRVPMRSA